MKIAGNPIPLPPKRISLVLEKRPENSDTEENASPLAPIGPKDSSSCVIDDRYDFPRSYNVQGFTGSHMNIPTANSMASIHGHGHLMTSTPNLIHSATIDRSKMNFYSNAAPRENNIFRFDFTSSAPPPEINRSTKPRKEYLSKASQNVQPGPTIDRKLKPGTFAKVRVEPNFTIKILKTFFQPQLAIGTNSLKRRGPESLSLSEVDDSAMLDNSLVNLIQIFPRSNFNQIVLGFKSVIRLIAENSQQM